MDCFFPVEKAVESVTAQDLIAAILCFRCADIFSGKRLSKGICGVARLTASTPQCCCNEAQQLDTLGGGGSQPTPPPFSAPPPPSLSPF